MCFFADLGMVKFDLYPDTREYTKLYRTELGAYGNGQSGGLFSSWDQETVNLHFKWMQNYSIDCVAFQVRVIYFCITQFFILKYFCANHANLTVFIVVEKSFSKEPLLWFKCVKCVCFILAFRYGSIIE